MTALIIPLFARKPDPDRDDGLDGGRGTFNGVVLALLFWAMVAALALPVWAWLHWAGAGA